MIQEKDTHNQLTMFQYFKASLGKELLS